MVSITISVPEEVRKAMKKFPGVNWSFLVRKVIMEEVERHELKEKMLKDLEKEKDFIDWSVELGKKAKKGRLKRILNEDNN